MKRHYEKVKQMSVALQIKEDTRADLMQRLQEATKDAPLTSNSLLGGLPVAYASAAVYCSVLFCIISITCKIY